MTERVPVVAVKAHPRSDELQLAARGWGWPTTDTSPSAEANQSFVEAMETLRAADLTQSATPGEQVATLIVDSDTREVVDTEQTS